MNEQNEKNYEKGPHDFVKLGSMVVDVCQFFTNNNITPKEKRNLENITKTRKSNNTLSHKKKKIRKVKAVVKCVLCGMQVNFTVDWEKIIEGRGTEKEKAISHNELFHKSTDAYPYPIAQAVLNIKNSIHKPKFYSFMHHIFINILKVNHG